MTLSEQITCINRVDLCFANGGSYGPHYFEYIDANGDPIDISDYNIVIQFKNPGKGGALLFEVPAGQIDITQVATGKFNFSLLAANTSLLPHNSEWGIHLKHKTQADPVIAFVWGIVKAYPLPANIQQKT